ncbi:hypothetical protein ACFLVN_04900 [Chloroflexota bacterium]
MAPAMTTGASRVTQAPGNTVVVDDIDDLILLKAHPIHEDWHCSLPPWVEPEEVPPWMDIRNAKITQLGGGRVELSMVLHAPIPEAPPPPFGWLSFGWQFEGGCVTDPLEPQKDNVTVHWKEGVGWWAQWGEIVTCVPREVQVGDSIEDFSITGAVVRVQVELDDLMLAVGSEEELLPWHAATRRLPFVWSLTPPESLWKTITVDIAPNRIVLVDPGDWPFTPPVVVGDPNPLAEPPAIFEPR